MKRRRCHRCPFVLLAWAIVALLVACGRGQGESETAVAPPAEASAPESPDPVEWALALHGGVGVFAPGEADPEGYYVALAEALAIGAELLAGGGAALEAVEMVVRRLEDDPQFNAGRGAVFTDRGTHELDAAIMDGRTLAAGAVAAVRNVRNPIALARQVMERSAHVLLTGSGADEYAREVGVRRAPQDYFTTDHRYRQWQRARREARRRGSGGGAPPAADEQPSGLDTVGAVALDRYGNLAAATSSGGTTNKRHGRVGDVPIIGAGTYASNRTAALSCTGDGDEFMRHVVAHEISARIEHGGATLEEAASAVVHDVLSPGDGGVIGVDAHGNLTLIFNSTGMFRGAADAGGRFEVGIWEEMRSDRPPAASAEASAGH